MRKINLEQIAQIANGTIRCGEKNYVIYGITAIGSAKDNEICVISNSYELKRLTKDVKAVVTQAALSPYLQRAKVPNVVVVNDIEVAEHNLMVEFTRLNS